MQRPEYFASLAVDIALNRALQVSQLMAKHLFLARLSSSFYLAALALVSVVVFSILLSLLVAPIGAWLEQTGAARFLVLSLLYVGAPLAAMFVGFGVASRCPACSKSYLSVEWTPVDGAATSERPNGSSLVRAHMNVVRTGNFSCSRCGHRWRQVR